MKRTHALGLGLVVCLTLAVSAEQRTTTYSYTPEWLIASIDESRTDVLIVTTSTCDTAGGRPRRMVDPNGLATSSACAGLSGTRAWPEGRDEPNNPTCHQSHL